MVSHKEIRKLSINYPGKGNPKPIKFFDRAKAFKVVCTELYRKNYTAFYWVKFWMQNERCVYKMIPDTT